MSTESLAVAINTLWVLVAAFLVFFMQAGFAMVEAGFTRTKNAGNIVLKNLMDFCVASIAYWVVGFGVMFGLDRAGVVGTSGFLLQGSFEHLGLSIPLLAFFLFQTVFAGTTATIVSGAMAERTKFASYLVFSTLITVLIYPVVGHWVWGGGWLAKLGFLDFAGSTVVHSIGGWASLAGLLILGPRVGRFAKDGSPRSIPGHSITLAALGVFILWFGWFGFNPGSTLAATDLNVARIAVTTNLGAAVGAMVALAVSYLQTRKFSVEMALNGALVGLVSITAPCAYVSPVSALIIGAVGGALVVPATTLLERFRIDDAVGAIPVHGVGGVWGTLAVGIFHEESGLLFGGGLGQLGVQALGVTAVLAFALGGSFLIFKVIDKVMGLRVTREEELQGLDHGEHGVTAYPEFASTAALTAMGDD